MHEGEKELSMRTLRPLTLFAIGLEVRGDRLREGATLIATNNQSRMSESDSDTLIKFSTQRSRRDVEIRQQYYIVDLTKGYKWKTRAYLECDTS